MKGLLHFLKYLSPKRLAYSVVSERDFDLSELDNEQVMYSMGDEFVDTPLQDTEISRSEHPLFF